MSEGIIKQYERIERKKGADDYSPPVSIGKVLDEIETSWVIPEFQRDFVWDIDKFTLLFDSIYRGYAIGNILLWKTKEKLAHRKVGDKDPIKIEDIKLGEHTYILDGQQRLTTLYGVLKSKPLYRLSRKRPKTYKIYFDVEKDQFIHETQKLKYLENKSIKHLIKEKKFDEFRFIDISQIFDKELKFPDNLIDEFRNMIKDLRKSNDITEEQFWDMDERLNSHRKRLSNFAKIMESYKIHQIVENNEDLDTVVTIFERINTQNVLLNIYDIMVAKTYENIIYNDKLYTFNLSRAIRKINYKNEIKKEEFSPDIDLSDDENLYYNINPTTLLRIISIILNSKEKIALQKKDIYCLKAVQIQENLASVRKVIQELANYLKNQLNIKKIDESLTDNKLLSFLAYVFSKEKYSNIDSELINKWFWNTTLFNRYPGAQLQRIEEDLKEYNKGKKEFFLQLKRDRNRDIFSKDHSIDQSKIIGAGYNKQNSLYISLIILMNSLNPRDFNGKIEINLSDYIGANTKNNKHHIIPAKSKAAKEIIKKYGLGKGEFLINNIANICLISSELNNCIKNKEPADYFKEYEKQEGFFENLEKRHLIDRQAYNDLKTGKYESFLIKRTARIIELIKMNCSIENETIELNNINEEDALEE